MKKLIQINDKNRSEILSAQSTVNVLNKKFGKYFYYDEKSKRILFDYRNCPFVLNHTDYFYCGMVFGYFNLNETPENINKRITKP